MLRWAQFWGRVVIEKGSFLGRVVIEKGSFLGRVVTEKGSFLGRVVSQKGMVSGEGSQDVPSPRESWDVHFGGKVVSEQDDHGGVDSEQDDHGGVVSEVSSVRRVVCGGDCLLGEWV